MTISKLGRISGNEKIIGRELRIYDDPKQLDRYTILMMDSPARSLVAKLYDCLGITGVVDLGEAIGTFTWEQSTAMPGSHLGKRIRFEQLPESIQRFLKERIGQ